MEEELAVGGPADQALDGASGTDGPGPLHLFADILKVHRQQSGGAGQAVVLGGRSHATQSPFTADRFEEQPPLPGSGTLLAQPCAHEKPSAWLENPGRLGEEFLEIGHVFRTLDRDHHVERGSLKIVGEPVAQQVARVGCLGIEVQGMPILGL